MGTAIYLNLPSFQLYPLRRTELQLSQKTIKEGKPVGRKRIVANRRRQIKHLSFGQAAWSS